MKMASICLPPAHARVRATRTRACTGGKQIEAILVGECRSAEFGWKKSQKALEERLSFVFCN
jgi:hypothetical protein